MARLVTGLAQERNDEKRTTLPVGPRVLFASPRRTSTRPSTLWRIHVVSWKRP